MIGPGPESAQTLHVVRELSRNDESPLRDALRGLYNHRGDESIDTKRLAYALRGSIDLIVDCLVLRGGPRRNKGRRRWVDRVDEDTTFDPASF